MQVHRTIQLSSSLELRSSTDTDVGDVSSFRVERFETIDSTNSELRRRALDGRDIDRVVVVADTQTAGRGRLGRAWVDQPGGSLLFSVGWRAPLAASRLSGLSLAIGVAVATALERQGIAQVQLKWPNDLMLRYCKFGGILVETVNPKDAMVDVIIGIGINLVIDGAAKDAVAAPVTSLSESGWCGERDALREALLAELALMMERFVNEGFGPYRAAWIARHALQQRNVTIWRSGRPVADGRAVDVDADGALLLQTPAGIRRFTSGESTLRAD